MNNPYTLYDKLLRENNQKIYRMEHKFLMLAINIMLERHSPQKVIEKLTEAIKWLNKNYKS